MNIKTRCDDVTTRWLSHIVFMRASKAQKASRPPPRRFRGGEGEGGDGTVFSVRFLGTIIVSYVFEMHKKKKNRRLIFLRNVISNKNNAFPPLDTRLYGEETFAMSTTLFSTAPPSPRADNDVIFNCLPPSLTE